MLLGIYIGSTYYVIRDIKKFYAEVMQRLKEEGYYAVKKDITSDDLIKLLITIALILCPGFNLLFSLAISNRGKAYKNLKDKMLKSGQIANVNETISKRIISDQVLRQDEEIMIDVLMPDVVEALKREDRIKNNGNDREEKYNEIRQPIFTYNYPLMDQTIEENDPNLDSGHAYVKK